MLHPPAVQPNGTAPCGMTGKFRQESHLSTQVCSPTKLRWNCLTSKPSGASNTLAGQLARSVARLHKEDFTRDVIWPRCSKAAISVHIRYDATSRLRGSPAS